MSATKAFLNDECGVASLEYAIIASVVVVALILVLASIAGRVLNKMTHVKDNVITGPGYD